MKLEAPVNVNYAATVVQLDRFLGLENCSNVKAAIIFGSQVIVPKDTEIGQVGLFFPVETALTKEFLGPNNLYRKAELGNVDATKTGFFEEHGRVKCMKFRGHKSEGFYVPLSFMQHLVGDLSNLKVGDVFDSIDCQGGPVVVCRKYVPKGNPRGTFVGQPKTKKVEDRIVDGQFRFHVDTEQLRRNAHKIQPTDLISISEKWHGTSAIVSNILVKKELKWYEKIAKKIGLDIRDSEYGITWASRKVVKGVGGEAKTDSSHFYGSDIWGVVADEVADRVPKGYTLYGEIVGYTPDGGAIQKGYHYGCRERQHQFLVYRVTITNEDGRVVEMAWPHMKGFCKKNGLDMVPELYYGRAGDFNDTVDNANNDIRSWQEQFVKQLETDYVYDQQCHRNNFEVPAEGVVVRVERFDECDSYKLKSFAFLKAESDSLDKGVIDIETEQSEEAV